MKDFERQNSQRPFNVESNSDDNYEPMIEALPFSDALEKRTMRFELLSAYIDGEVTPEERQQVQEWLDTDPKLQKLYTQLLRLQQDINYIPAPTEPLTTDLITDQVFQKIDQQKNQRLVLVGGALLTVLLISFASHLLPGQKPSSQMAHQSVNMSEAESEPLMIALNQPIVEIPKLEKD